MSYILDALNKADKDRQQHNPNTPLPISNKAINHHQTSNRKFGLILMGFVLLTIIVWFALNQQTIPKPKEVSDPAPKPILATPLPKHTQGATLKAVETITPHIMALDISIRDQLPPIRISAHIYGSDVNKRMVIINDKVMREGQYITEQLMLESILTDRVQFNFVGVVFTMKIKDQWPPY